MAGSELVPSEQTAIEAELERLAELKVKVAEAQGIRREYDALRASVQERMMAAGMDKSRPVSGIYALISRTEEVVIEDQDKLDAWLEENVMSPDDYYTTKPNMDAIKAKAAEVLQEDGELIPGIKVVTRETVNIRSAK